MRKSIYLLLIFADFLLLLLAPLLLVPIALCFARKTDEKTAHYGQDPNLQRYRLPQAFFFLETPDEHLPGGLYEPTVQKIYDRCGWWICSWYWLGLRNVGHGMWWRYGKEVSKHIRHMSAEEQVELGIYSRERKLWLIKFKYGWKSVNDWHSVKTEKGIWAVPRFSVRLAGQE